MTTIQFRDWELAVDYALTKNTYENIDFGGSESCICNDCKNFARNIEQLYPNEIRELFQKLGIDFKKECEIWRMCKERDGLHRYNGWFHYKGSFKGENHTKKIREENSTFELVPITENFSIGFRYSNQLTHFDDKENLVQIEFEVKLPWILDTSLESDN